MVIFYYNSQTASIVFVDTPVGSGYSYASTAAGFVLSDSKFANQTYNFIRTVSDTINKTPYILLNFLWPPLVLFLSPPLHMFILILKYCMQWLNEHPQYIPNRVILATDSYSGIIAPVVVEKILEGKYWTKFCLSSIGINVYFCHKIVARINYMYLFICTWHYR